MDKSAHKLFQAHDRSYFAILKKDIHKAAIDAGFDTVTVATIDIILSEITSNLFKHAKGGEVLMKIFGEGEDECIEILCIDDGPGIDDLARVLFDGYSSTHTLGQGLGSIKRQSDVFDIYSLKDWGTVLLSRIYKQKKVNSRATKKAFTCTGLVIAKTGESVSGDGYYLQELKDGFRLLVADGLGHGSEAHLAVEEAIKVFRICPDEDTGEILRFIHNDIRKTRGIVATVISYKKTTKQWKMTGVGNIATRIIDGTYTRVNVSYNGIVGHNLPNAMTEHVFDAHPGQMFICCSDGIKSRWDLLKFPGLIKHDPSTLAAVLYKEFGRRTDDMSVIITKLN
jgi:anti-sigma regulatory factor (Ser/Thr protein kinase)